MKVHFPIGYNNIFTHICFVDEIDYKNTLLKQFYLNTNLKMRKIVVFILFFFSSCGDEDNTKLNNKLFEEPILFSSHNQIITLYSSNPYDIIINYNKTIKIII